MTTPRPRLDVWQVLAAADAASPVEAVEAVAAELSTAFGAEAVSLLIADLSGRALIRLAHVVRPEEDDGDRRDQEESATTLPFDGGPAEQTLRTQTVQVVAPPEDGARSSGRWQVLAPVTERGDALGLLEMTLASAPSPETVRDIAAVAHLMSYVVIAAQRHTDLFEWGQRSRPFTLSAEIQQRLLPPARACEATAFTLVGWLEPAASIGGDTFDYSLARDVLHLSLTDSMGHGVASALTATVCTASLRGSRRVGASLLDQADEANAALCRHASRTGSDDFATGLVGRLDLTAGVLEIVNAGHVPPFLVRGGTVSVVDLPAAVPFGMFGSSRYAVVRLSLEPGDRLVFVTDGMLERNVAGADLPAALGQTQALHPREAVRAMAERALEAAGHALADDATLLCLDWHGGHHRGRETVAGADPDRASDPLD